MLNHIFVPVCNLQVSCKFYLRMLAPLGYEKLFDYPEEKLIGLGTTGMADFWLKEEPHKKSALHIAFNAINHTQVDNCYTVAIAAGGKDNGKPGIREHYDPSYYATFVFDPDGYNIEIVCEEIK